MLSRWSRGNILWLLWGKIRNSENGRIVNNVHHILVECWFAIWFGLVFKLSSSIQTIFLAHVQSHRSARWPTRSRLHQATVRFVDAIVEKPALFAGTAWTRCCEENWGLRYWRRNTKTAYCDRGLWTVVLAIVLTEMISILCTCTHALFF